MNPQKEQTDILELTLQNFKQQVIDTTEPILIDFWAPWCGPCRTMKPILDQTAQILGDKCRVAQVNVDEQPELAQAFGIRGIPNCILMRGDQVLASYTGVIPAKQLATEVLHKLK